MAFLDNSGDIILDAVLTDTGRARLAKGDGTFKIVKFALADDEIDYSLYQNDNHALGAHASGSAYYDLNILMTPILEAFTNNASGMKSKLISVPRTNLLYLPVLKLFNLSGFTEHQQYTTLGVHVVAVDVDTVAQWTPAGASTLKAGVLDGYNTDFATANKHRIRVDQGLDTIDISNTQDIDQDLYETQYIVEMDNRLGSIIDDGVGTAPAVSYIDDDNIASYYITLGDESMIVDPIGAADPINPNKIVSSLNGPRGSRAMFKIKASIDLTSSTYLFDTFGATTTDNSSPTGDNYQYIDTNIRIVGATTGVSIDIPIRYVKKV